MQNNAFKKFFFRKYIVSSIIASAAVFIVLLALTGIIVWANRASIFRYFGNEYVRENQEQAVSGALSQESFVINAVKKANPAVVSIVLSKNVPTYSVVPKRQNPLGDLFPGFDFFFNSPEYRQNGTEKREVGSGSGFFVSPDGLIVTNKHVVDQTDVEYTVFTNDGKKHAASVIARDPILDVAVLKISQDEGKDYAYLSLGDSDSLEIGQSVIAIGNALGEFKNTVSVGIVSGLSRSITAGDMTGNTEVLDEVIQTDAAINPGNSGGPLLDLSGRVIGVNVAIAQGSQNVGFALPINSVKAAVESVKATGKIVRPYLGVRYTVVTDELAKSENLPVKYGMLVRSGSGKNEPAVIPGSPADKAGIKEGDIILEVDGVRLDENASLSSEVRKKKVGDKVALKIMSRGAEKTLEVTLEEAK